MAAGLPIVATASSGVESLIEQGVNGAVVPPDHTQALAGALIELACDAERRARYGRASHERAAAFTVDRMVDRTLDAYTQVGAARRRAERARGTDVGPLVVSGMGTNAIGARPVATGAVKSNGIEASGVEAGAVQASPWAG
jgi:hypothetical protein